MNPITNSVFSSFVMNTIVTKLINILLNKAFQFFNI